jgi:hypothetical protein
MKLKIIFVWLLFSGLMAACGDSMTANSSSNMKATNTVVVSTNSATANSGSSNATADSSMSTNSNSTTTNASMPKTSFELPPFPFPPNASVEYPIDASLITNRNGETTFGYVDDRLRQALEANGYESASYYAVAGGFVITTAMEQFDSNGQPAARERFSEIETPPSAFTAEFWRNALRGRRGRYRVIAFMITDQDYVATDETPSYGSGRNLVFRGAKFLPAEMRPLAYTPQHRCLALVYEYGRSRVSGEVSYIRSGALPANQHLRNLLETLRRN